MSLIALSPLPANGVDTVAPFGALVNSRDIFGLTGAGPVAQTAAVAAATISTKTRRLGQSRTANTIGSS